MAGPEQCRFATKSVLAGMTSYSQHLRGCRWQTQGRLHHEKVSCDRQAIRRYEKTLPGVAGKVFLHLPPTSSTVLGQVRSLDVVSSRGGTGKVVAMFRAVFSMSYSKLSSTLWAPSFP